MSNKIKLDEILNSYKVGKLKELAKTSGITGYSKLKKAELIEVLSEQLQTVDTSSLELPDELLAILQPAVEETEASAPEKSAAVPKATRTPILGVAPHVMNVLRDGQAPLMPLNQKPVNKKIYPNDSCPCGSGLKYKKCCGR